MIICRDPLGILRCCSCSRPFLAPDLLTGANDTHIATLVERNTRFTMLVKIPRKDTTTVVAALAKHIGKLPEELRRSLTSGSRQRDACPQALHGCHQRPGLLL